MPEITRRRTGELLRKLFEILMPLPDGMQARDALAKLANSIKLSDYENGSYESGGRRFEKIVRFATVDCVKAGWLQKNKGRWIITDAGKVAYAQYPDPEAFYKQAVKLYHVWKASQPDSEPETETEVADKSSGKAASITYEEAEEQAWTEIDQYLRSMQPYDFQDLVAALLRGMGYYVSWVAPPGKDGGIDILAWTDPLGTRPPRIKVQVKRQGQAVSVDGLRTFMAVLGDDDVGIFVSVGGFTKDAAEEARTQEKRKITLVDLETLLDLWVEHYTRLSDDARRWLPLKPIYFLAPEP
jgi:restriction system protein